MPMMVTAIAKDVNIEIPACEEVSIAARQAAESAVKFILARLRRKQIPNLRQIHFALKCEVQGNTFFISTAGQHMGQDPFDEGWHVAIVLDRLDETTGWRCQGKVDKYGDFEIDFNEDLTVEEIEGRAIYYVADRAQEIAVRRHIGYRGSRTYELHQRETKDD